MHFCLKWPEIWGIDSPFCDRCKFLIVKKGGDCQSHLTFVQCFSVFYGTVFEKKKREISSRAGLFLPCMFTKFGFKLDTGKPCIFAQNELKFDTIKRGKPCMFVKKLIQI